MRPGIVMAGEQMFALPKIGNAGRGIGHGAGEIGIIFAQMRSAVERAAAIRVRPGRYDLTHRVNLAWRPELAKFAPGELARAKRTQGKAALAKLALRARTGDKAVGDRRRTSRPANLVRAGRQQP